MWIDNKFIPVTLVKIIPQELIRYKSEEKDGYSAAVVGVDKKDLKKKKGQKVKYKMVIEYDIDDTFIQDYKEGSIIDEALLDGVDSVSVIWTSKGKGFQWAMKRFHLKGWPKTHGSKFHRQIGSLGNRKPRRVQKWHPHAGRMGGWRITLQNIAIVDKIQWDEKLFALKGSLPGPYNGLLSIEIV